MWGKKYRFRQKLPLIFVGMWYKKYRFRQIFVFKKQGNRIKTCQILPNFSYKV